MAGTGVAEAGHFQPEGKQLNFVSTILYSQL